MRLYALLPLLGALALAGCEDAKPDNSIRAQQARKAQDAARSISFTDNAEIENIKRRIEITAQPGLLGFVLLMNEAGQPILYEGVHGKITSGAKRLTEPDRVTVHWEKPVTRQSPSDEGTWGHSGEYIYYWNQNGEYRQWNGKYLYSDKPFRLRIEPLIINVQGAAANQK